MRRGGESAVPRLRRWAPGAVDFIAVTVAVDAAPRKFVTSTTIEYTPPGSRSSARSSSSDELIFAGSDRILSKSSRRRRFGRHAELVPHRPSARAGGRGRGEQRGIARPDRGRTHQARVHREGVQRRFDLSGAQGSATSPSLAANNLGLSSIRSATLNAVRGIAIGSLPV